MVMMHSDDLLLKSTTNSIASGVIGTTLNRCGCGPFFAAYSTDNKHPTGLMLKRLKRYDEQRHGVTRIQRTTMSCRAAWKGT